MMSTLIRGLGTRASQQHRSRRLHSIKRHHSTSKLLSNSRKQAMPTPTPSMADIIRLRPPLKRLAVRRNH